MAETEVKTIIKIETGESEVTIGGLRKREGDGDSVPYDLSGDGEQYTGYSDVAIPQEKAKRGDFNDDYNNN